MYENYRNSKRSLYKQADIKGWNVSTRVEKRQISDNHLPNFRSSPDPKKSKIQFPQKYSPEPRSFLDVSSNSKLRNFSSSRLDSSTKIAKSSYITNKIRSLAFKGDLDRKYKVPNFVAHAILEIFTTNTKDPIALGLLIAEKLIITSYFSVPNERFANRCIFRFINDKVYYKPRSEKFFYTSPEHNITVLAVSRVKKDIQKKKPLRIEGKNELKLGDVVFCAESTCFRAQVSNLDTENFAVSSKFTPLSGSPIFNSSWNFIGLAYNTSMTYKYTECTNLESILSILDFIRSRYNINITQLTFVTTQEFSQQKDMKWFEYNGDYVEVFDTESAEWSYKRCGFEILRHCATVSISDDESLLVGGIRRELAMDEVYKYKSSSNEIYQMAHMGVARSHCAAIF